MAKTKAKEGSSAEQVATGELEATEKQVQEALTSDFEEMVAKDGLVPTNDKLPSSFEMELIEELERCNEEITALKSKEFTIFELAEELYRRFGVYTVFLGRPPRDNDVHPFSGDTMTRYEVGLAYQKHNQAMAQGKLQKDFGYQHEINDQTREASKVHRAEMEARKENPEAFAPAIKSFAERTSVGHQNQSSMRTVARPNDAISEDVTPEPNLHGQTIRPDW